LCKHSKIKRNIINRNYELIRRFKTTTTLLNDLQLDLSEKDTVIYKDIYYFGAKSKGYDAKMKRAVKEYHLGITDVLRNKRISSKRAPKKLVYAVTKEIFKAGKVLVITTQRVNLKMLCDIFLL
jgi:IS5 family transposase